MARVSWMKRRAKNYVELDVPMRMLNDGRMSINEYLEISWEVDRARDTVGLVMTGFLAGFFGCLLMLGASYWMWHG